MADRLPTPTSPSRPARAALRGLVVAATVAAGGLLAAAPASAATAHEALATSGAGPAECDADYLGPLNPVLIGGQRFASGAVGPLWERPPAPADAAAPKAA